MPQLLHPSFLRIGRRSAAVLLLLAGLGLLMTGLARPTDATDPYVVGSDLTRVTRISSELAATALDRAARTERMLGLTGLSRRTVDRVVDRRGQRTYDEVTGLDAQDRPIAVLRFGLDGQLQAATRLGWRPGSGPALAAAADAIRAAGRLAGTLGLRPFGTATAARSGANGWSVRWPRTVDGVPVPGDGLRVQLWPDGSFHALTAAEHPLAADPSFTIPAASAGAIVTALLDRWIPLAERRDARIVGMALAWVAPNDTFASARPDAPAEIRRLAWVVTVRSTGSLSESLRGLEVSIDAGDGSLLGGDVLR